MGKRDNTVTKSEDDVTPTLTIGRTKTLDDPMTTGLLAEVARRSRTVDFDREVIEIMLDSIDHDHATETVHPHVKKRG